MGIIWGVRGSVVGEAGRGEIWIGSGVAGNLGWVFISVVLAAGVGDDAGVEWHANRFIPSIGNNRKIATKNLAVFNILWICHNLAK